MSNIYKFTNSNGIFLSFREYECRDQFEEFLKYICRVLNTVKGYEWEGPYSILAELEVYGKCVVAMFHGEAGCCLRFLPEDVCVADRVMKIFSEN